MTAAADLIAGALALPPDDPARPLLVAAAINQALGRSYIIVGGVAVDLHTGAYHPTDIDLQHGELTGIRYGYFGDRLRGDRAEQRSGHGRDEFGVAV